MMKNMDGRIKKIIICFDNSDLSFVASESALTLAKAFCSEVIAVHAYNAFMHEGAFRIMETILPSEYQRKDIIKKQREVHSSLINVGMEKISLSYLKSIEDMFRVENISFRSRVKEGKNFKVISEIISDEDAELVIIGSSGFNNNGGGYLGSVCLRVLRNYNSNFLVIKKELNFKKPRFIICLDGSYSAINAFRMAKMLADKYNAELHLIYAFDSTLHKEIFERLKESLINKEGFSFNSKKQEMIHDEFIDKGLERVGHMIIDKAEEKVFYDMPAYSMVTSGLGLVGKTELRQNIKKVLEGNIYKKICDYASEINADIIFLGRTGRHFVEGMDLGSVAENIVRFSPCSVFLAKHEEYKGWVL